MAPTTMARKRSQEPAPVKAVKGLVEEGRNIRKTEVKEQRLRREKEEEDADYLKKRERIRRLEKMISRLHPEEQERVSIFMDKIVRWIQYHQKAGSSPRWIEDKLEQYLANFCTDVWGQDSPYNKKRVEVMIRFLKANEIIPD